MSGRHKTLYLAHLFCILLGLLYTPCVAWGEQEDIVVPSWSQKNGGKHFFSKDTSFCTVTIQGNTFLNSEKLHGSAAEEIAAYLTDGSHLSDIDDAAFQMEYTYRLAGFVDALVTYTVEKPSTDNCRVFFHVQEGERQMIHHISVEGNTVFASNMLLLIEKNLPLTPGEQNIPLPYVAGEMSSLVKGIRNYYLAAGYLDVRVEAEKKILYDSTSNVHMLIHIHEGKQYAIDTVLFTGDVLPELNEDLEGLKSTLIGQKFEQRHRLMLRVKLEEIYKNGGYADVAIQPSEQKDVESGTVLLQAKITSGPLVSIHDITLSGLDRTKEEFVYERLKFRPGEPYSLAKENESFSALYETGLFQSVHIDLEENLAPQSRNLQVQLVEKRNREVYVEPGWGSYELLRLGAGYRDWNLFGNGRRFRFHTGASFKGRSVEMAFTEPWLLETDIVMDIPLYYRYREEPTFTTENSGFAVYFSKNFPDKIQVTAGYQNDTSKTTNIDLVDISNKATDNYSSGIFTLQLIRDTRNDYFFPTKGYRGFASVDIASPLMGGSLSFYRLKAGARVFRPIGKSSVLGIRYAAGILFPFGDQEGIPVAERFYNGGENSVRSFRESELGPSDNGNNPLGGAAYNVFSLEWRHKFTETIAASLFLDAGNVSPNSGPQVESLLAGSQKTLIDATLQDFFSDMRLGIGFGLQYLLPVGPARLDIAFNPNADKEIDESEFVIHFSIGMAF